MAEKVLPGVSREALGFLTANFKDLAKMSALPALLMGGLSTFQIYSLSGLYRAMGTMVDGEKFDPNFFGAYFRGMGLVSLSSLVALLLQCYLFVQIIRFQKTGTANWLSFDRATIVASLMTLLYAFGIMMLTMLAYIGSIFAFALVAVIVGGIGGAILGGSTAAAILFGILGVVGIFALLGGLYWFMFRFLVGLPGVALGHSPDFFKDMWPLAKGEGWGLPLRVILATIVAYIPIGIIMVLTMGVTFRDLFSNPIFNGQQQDPQVVFPLMADLFERMAPLSVVSVLLFMPVIWFLSLLLGAAFQRFRNRQTQAVAK